MTDDSNGAVSAAQPDIGARPGDLSSKRARRQGSLGLSVDETGLFPDLTPEAQTTFKMGILPYQTLKDLVATGRIRSELSISDSQIQPASIDLRLGPTAYQVRASFLPSKSSRVMSRVEDLKIRSLDLQTPCVLDRGCVYIIPVLEEMNLPADILGKANPKSTVGRLDVFTRLITNYGDEFETVPQGYKGKLYLEVAPRTFSVVVHTGTRLNQLRLLRGSPAQSDNLLNELHLAQTLIFTDDESPGRPVISNGLWISVDLAGDERSNVVGYRARKHTSPIDLDKIDHYEPGEFWDAINRSPKQELILDPGDFYILASKERVRVPPNFAAEMVAYDPSVGEFRLHYAGFFDPGFGYGDADVAGTRAVLEVRSHEVPFVLRHGQRVGRFIYERLMAVPDRLYGAAIGSSYQRQELALSKQFKRL